jgi:hypothetical protein
LAFPAILHLQSSILDSRGIAQLDVRAGTAQNSPMLATWRSFTWSSEFATGKVLVMDFRAMPKGTYPLTVLSPEKLILCQ